MAIMGFVLIKEEELNKYKDGTFRTHWIVGLNEKIRLLSEELDRYKEDPTKLIMGRYYSDYICDKLLRIIPWCRREK